MKTNFNIYIILMMLLALTVSNSTAQQLEAAITGDVEGGQFGYSVAVSADGTVFAAGGRYSSSVKVFFRDGNVWPQRGATIYGVTSSDQFGYAVSISADGNIVAIGGREYDGNGLDAGHVRIYEWNGTEWLQLGSDINGEQAGDNMGCAVSISAAGDRVAVAARFNDNGGVDAGHVKIFDWNGAEWIQQGNDINGEAAGDISGQSVSITPDGNRLAIGSRTSDAPGIIDAGHVRVFDWDGTDWVQVGNDIDGDAAGDQFGRATRLSANGNRIIIGARYSDQGAFDAGQVKVYDWDGTSWTQIGMDLLGENAGDAFGRSVAISGGGNRIAAGARYNDGSATDAGHVRIFDWNGTEWLQLGSDLDGYQADDRFGADLVLSTAGNTLVVCAQGTENYTGEVRVFSLDPATSIEQSQIDDEKIMILPNPTNGIFEINGLMNGYTIRVLTSNGSLVNSLNCTESSHYIDISKLPAGLFFVEILNDKNSKISLKKIIKQ